MWVRYKLIGIFIRGFKFYYSSKWHQGTNTQLSDTGACTPRSFSLTSFVAVSINFCYLFIYLFIFIYFYLYLFIVISLPVSFFIFISLSLSYYLYPSINLQCKTSDTEWVYEALYSVLYISDTVLWTCHTPYGNNITDTQKLKWGFRRNLFHFSQRLTWTDYGDIFHCFIREWDDCSLLWHAIRLMKMKSETCFCSSFEHPFFTFHKRNGTTVHHTVTTESQVHCLHVRKKVIQ